MDFAARLAELRRELAARRARPEAFRDVTELPWADRDLGRQFLSVGRRSPEQTDLEVGFLVDRLNLVSGNRVLDLMCGDGRVALPIAQLGCHVTGVDINEYAIEQARRGAALMGFDERARFLCQDVTELEVDGPCDVAICIFGQLSGLRRSVAVATLRRLRDQIAAGGQLLIDMHLGPAEVRDLDGVQHWELYPNGWLGTDEAALVLDEYFTHTERLTYVRRSYCLDLATAELHRFGQAGQFYDARSMGELLAEAGFELACLYGDFDGRAYDDDTSPNLIVLAER